ncbi:MAG: hypothetical protein P0120_00970 [Nitrospira sp.]|nr:hypothetical protein [Nitrospira sp.]
MDWVLLIALLVVLVIGGAGAFVLYRFVGKTKHEFQHHQPALRITNMSAMNAGEVITLTPEVENVGYGVAHDCIVQLAGWEGRFEVQRIHPNGPRYHRHSVPIVLGQDAPIRMKVLSRCYLRLAYRDCWEQRYECWYPVAQIKNVNSSLYDIQVDLAHPELTEPHPSFREMRKLLRRTPMNETLP